MSLKILLPDNHIKPVLSTVLSKVLKFNLVIYLIRNKFLMFAEVESKLYLFFSIENSVFSNFPLFF